MVKLKRISAGDYVTHDGRFKVEHDEHRENDCTCVICEQGSYGCPNGGIAVERAWLVWDNEVDDYLYGTGPLQFETKRDAVAYLAHYLSTNPTRTLLYYKDLEEA